MSTLKKVLALTLAIAMVLSLNVFAAFKDQDKINEDCVSAMEMMNTLGIMLGDENNNANPEKTITRAEAAAMIFRLMNKGNADASMYNGMKVFTDVPSGIWYEGYVNYCYTMGIVQGRTATTFDPSAPVTGYEIAKMLLTCLKYNAEKQGYTGANWAKNVQNDAFAANLLEDYGMGLALPAQRQWVAVMFNQALNCFVAKYYLGELTIDEKDENTLGYRNFGLETVKGTLSAIQNAVVEGTAADKGYSKVITGTKDSANVYSEYKYVAEKNLLGQQVKVTYNAKTGKVFGIAATGKSKLGVAKLDEVTKSGTGADTKYTVGTVAATAPETTKVFYPNEQKVYTAAGAFSTYRGQNSVAEVRAVDTDANGVFDYIMIDFSDFGTVRITSKGVATFNGVSLDADEVKEQVNYINTVSDKDFVKVTANVFTGKFDVEALTSTVGKLTRKTMDEGAVASVVLAGSTYKISADGLSSVATNLNQNLGSKVEFYTDGKYIVKASLYEDSTTGEMPTLVMLTAKGTKASDDIYTPGTTYMVKVLGLDNKLTEYEFYRTNANTTGTAHGNLVAGTVYKLVDNTDGTYDLVAYSTAGYVNQGTEQSPNYKYRYAAGTGETLEYKTGKLGNALVGDAKMFMVYTKDSKPAYTVVGLSDLKQNQTFADESSFYYYTMTNGIKTLVCGMFGGTLAEADTSVYAIADGDSYDELNEDGKTYTKVDVMYAGKDKAETITLGLKNANKSANDMTMYKVVINAETGYATLTPVVGEGKKIAAVNNAINGMSKTLASIATVNSGNLTDISKDVVVVLQVEKANGAGTKSVAFSDMDTVFAAYEDATASEHDTYASITAGAYYDTADEEITILYVVATLAE